MSDDLRTRMEERRPPRRGIQKKLILAGIIQLTVFFAVIFLYLPFLMNEFRRDIVAQRLLAERLKEKEVETIARFLAFELGRLPVLNDLKSAYFSPGTKRETEIEVMMDTVAKLLWEKCAFNDEVVYLDLVSCVGDSVLIVAPYGKEASSAYFHERELEQAKAATKLTRMAPGGTGDSKYVQRYLMPLYVEGSRWGVARIVISTEDFKVVDANVADRETFKQNSFIVFAIMTVVGFGVSLLVFSYCARQVSEPLNRLTATMEEFGRKQDFDLLFRKLASGDESREDEVGLLKTTFSEMAHKLRGTMSRLQSTIAEKEKAVADREKALMDLRDSQRALHESAKLATLGEVGASFAHEINNKIQPAKITTVGLLEAKDGPKVTHEDLEGILNSINDCARYVDKFKTFARPQHRFEDDVDINSVIGDVLELVEKPLQKSNVRVVTQLADALPHISGDPSELAQVFMNFLFNARDAIESREAAPGRPGRAGTITIRTRAGEKAVKVDIADDGVGMSKDVLAKLFTPFFTTKGLAKGTGLGLSISKGIIDAHKGSIDVQSEPGKGTTFTFTLPAG